ncbi:CGNR zinc finger domain-containing protein [Mycobacterium deserti]|uniref:CGNR zinc finger domain-containing protein n=1 Tax=Mycobacterium deserti TaxID=2978347 RepID=A0ABT2MLW4_9MYCO|nr:CGNR zinc finger domain-containing protein [Mycobacterium deserti]MCT7661951.1 CGNR zinc finger domain-containing protein [Mycobacterium deserti]
MTRAPGQWTGDNEEKPAPAPLDRVQNLVNTIDIEIGQDRLARAEDAAPWLVANELLTADSALDAAELDFVCKVREALRALLVHNSGGPAPGAGELAVLREVAASGSAQAVIGDRGDVTWRATGDSLRARLAGLLLIVRDAQRDGNWQRLKACANDDCRWVFYDQSRNRGGAWCNMAVCGNRLKNRDFRARRRQPSR